LLLLLEHRAEFPSFLITDSREAFFASYPARSLRLTLSSCVLHGRRSRPNITGSRVMFTNAP
jgi:hypothetical protein